MSKLRIVSGDICKTDAVWIVHQCNCKGTKTKGMSKHIFENFPYANTYASDMKRTPGAISIHGYDHGEPQGVINLYAQLSPGQPRESGDDTKATRREWFGECLDHLKALNEYENITYRSFAFPYKIGCGFGGGDWSHYLSMITSFSEEIDGIVYIHKV